MPSEMTLARVEAQTIAVVKARIKMTYGDWDDEPARRRTDIYHLCAEAEEAE